MTHPDYALARAAAAGWLRDRPHYGSLPGPLGTGALLTGAARGIVPSPHPPVPAQHQPGVQPENYQHDDHITLIERNFMRGFSFFGI